MVTGGAGFIGTHLVQKLMRDADHRVVNVDKLSYASNDCHVKKTRIGERYHFVQQDLKQFEGLSQLLKQSGTDVVFHLAAETHVDRSIKSPCDFVQSNIIATQKLLEATRQHFDELSTVQKSQFRFIHVTTDEVFGSLGVEDPPFTEDSTYLPNSPYSASKAASDHLVRAWNRTYGLPTITAYCSNNYGPYQFPEKFIPVVISNCLQGKEIPVYGDGENIRDWI
ncbi:MAG: GDP-mannose 4,6-dehydratase, partial [Planctomycetota bacterium]|nr:GDP-mannose 4,6-dehydratase [Planctomycetota bacterium]